MENKVFKRTERKEETVKIREAHKKRKRSYMALKHLVKAASYGDSAPIKAAAEMILEVMKNYGQAYYSPVTEASSLFINLIHDLGRENHVGKVALIMGAEEAIASLNLHNEEFINLYSGRSLLAEGEKMDGNMQDARVRTDQMFEVLADSINVFYHANEVMPSGEAEVSALLCDLIVFINSYLRQYESIMARRSASARSGDKPEPPDIVNSEQRIVNNE